MKHVKMNRLYSGINTRHFGFMESFMRKDYVELPCLTFETERERERERE